MRIVLDYIRSKRESSSSRSPPSPDSSETLPCRAVLCSGCRGGRAGASSISSSHSSDDHSKQGLSTKTQAVILTARAKVPQNAAAYALLYSSSSCGILFLSAVWRLVRRRRRRRRRQIGTVRLSVGCVLVYRVGCNLPLVMVVTVVHTRRNACHCVRLACGQGATVVCPDGIGKTGMASDKRLLRANGDGG